VKRRCPQCWKLKPYPSAFIGKQGLPIKQCSVCTARYSNWHKKTQEERRTVASSNVGVPNLGVLRARLMLRSGNRKLGGIPASITSRNTCPLSCAFYDAGCYAEYHVLASHWRRVGTGERGDPWATFCEDVRALPDGQLWRHNVAGDLPGDGEQIDAAMLCGLLYANLGKRGFTFTHKDARLVRNRDSIIASLECGFTVNLSANNLEHADALHALEIAPVAVVLPADETRTSLLTPEGRRVTVCPAETNAMLTCAECELCAQPNRKTIVGFRAHGQSSALVTSLVRGPQP
jgi:hypothetical protein